MKALTIRQPWASLIMQGVKREEYRGYPLPLGLLAIHAGRAAPGRAELAAYMREATAQGWDVSEEEAREWMAGLQRGVVLGVVEVVGHRRVKTAWGDWASALRVLEVFERPIRAQGQVRVWEWTAPEAA